MCLKGPLRYPLLTSRGSLLIVTLWMIAILAILSVSIGQHVRQKISLADRIEVRNWLCGVSEVGIAQAVYKLRQKKEADEGYLALNDTYTSGRKDFFNVPVGDATYTVSYVYKDPRSGKSKTHYGVEDEEGKVNINVADAKSLSEFFQKIGRVELELADQIGYSVADWRDTDDSLSHPDYGAEDDFYEDLEAPYESKDYKFESIEELLLVRGMTPELYETVRPFVTVYGQGVVNINTASREVLLWLGMDDSLADKILAFREGADLEEGTPDDSVFTQPGDWNVELAKRVKLTGNDSALLNQIMATKQVGINSKYFRIRCMGALPRKHQAMEIEAVADLEGKILSWSMGTPRRMTLEELQEAGQERVE